MKAYLKILNILNPILLLVRLDKNKCRNLCRDMLDGLISHTLWLKRKNNSVLIVRLDAIGDFIIWLDSAKEIRSLYPTRKIILCANSRWADLAKYFSYWDEVIPVEPKRLESDFAYRYKLLWGIRLRRFEIAIQPTFTRLSLQGDSLIRASCAVQRIGSTGDLDNIPKLDRNRTDIWYTNLITANPAPLMEIVRNAEFIRGLGIRDFLGSVTKIAKLIDLPKELKISEPYCVVFPGSNGIQKTWPPKKFINTIAYIAQSFGFQIVLCGSQNEISVCDEIAEKSPVAVTNLAGKTSLAELVEVIRHSILLLGNDSSSIHIAAAVGTRSVCILGGGHFGRFVPYIVEKTSTQPLPIAVYHEMDCFGCNWQCKYEFQDGRPPCIIDIELKQVMNACTLSYDRVRRISDLKSNI